MDILVQDLRYALRLVRRAPAFAALIVGTLAVGIGANATIFSVVDARPVASISVCAARTSRSAVRERRATSRSLYGNVSFPNFTDWRAATHSFSGLFAISGGGANLTTNGETERVSTVPIVGKHLRRTRRSNRSSVAASRRRRTNAGGPHVAVLSDGFWRRRFGGDPSIIGRVIDIDDAPTTVVGVMPPGFVFPAGGRIARSLASARHVAGDAAMYRAGCAFSTSTLASRLARRSSRRPAEMRQIAARLESEYPDDNVNQSALVMPLRDAVAGSVREPLAHSSRRRRARARRRLRQRRQPPARARGDATTRRRGAARVRRWTLATHAPVPHRERRARACGRDRRRCGRLGRASTCR